MAESTLDSIKRNRVYFVDSSNDAAIRLMMKLANGRGPGSIIPLDADEFDALQTAFIAVDLPDA